MPAPPGDDFDGLDDDLARGPVAVVPPLEVVTAPEFADDLDRLEPLVSALVAGFAAGRVRLDDPQERQHLVELHARLDDVIRTMGTARTMIEHVFLRGLIDKGAQALPLPDGREVVLEQPRGDYVTRDKELYDALLAIARSSGEVPEHEVHEAIKVTTIYKANHARLNAMAKKRSALVALAIDSHRTFVAPPPERGRVRFP